MATPSKLIGANAMYGYDSWSNSAATHMYIGAASSTTKYNYRSRITFQPLSSLSEIGSSRIAISRMTLYLYRNTGGTTTVTAGCSSSGDWGAAMDAAASGSVGASDGWYAIDITALKAAVLSYGSNWFIHLSGGTPAVRCDGTGKSTRAYIVVEWEYVAATITGNLSNVTLGNPVIFTIKPEVSGETHTLTYSIGDLTGTIAQRAGSSISWTPPRSLASEITGDETATMQIRMTAYDSAGNVQRTETYYQAVTVPSDARPVISTVGAALVNGLSGYGLAGRSMLDITPSVDMNSALGATLSSVTAAITGGQTIKWTALSEDSPGIFTGGTARSGVLASAGTVTVTLTATDSRGRTASASQTITVSAYSAPEIALFSVERIEPVYDANEQLSGWQASELGGYVWVNLIASIAGVAPAGTHLNTIRWTIQAVNTETGETITKSGTGAQALTIAADRTIFPDPVDESASWQYTAAVSDTAGGRATQYSAVLPAHAGMSMSPDKWGFAVGMIANGTKDAPSFEVDDKYQAHFYGGAYGADGRRMDKVSQTQLLTVNASFAAYAAGQEARVSRVGPVVFLDGKLRNTAALASNFSSMLVTLPEWARPAQDVSVVQQGSGARTFWIYVTIDGNVTLSRYREGADYVSAPAGQQFLLTACWIAADAFV